MPVEPGYGETPVSDDDAVSLRPHVLELLGAYPLKVEVYDLEQSIQDEVAADLLGNVLAGDLGVADMVRDVFLIDLHRQLYGDVWTWGGYVRRRELNLGVAPEQISVQLRAALDSYLYRWQNTADWTPRQLAIAVHAEAVRIHPFVDGNGRTTRLLADLVFSAAQDAADLQQFDWDVDKATYVRLLREFDATRDPGPLAASIPTRPLLL